MKGENCDNPSVSFSIIEWYNLHLFQEKKPLVKIGVLVNFVIQNLVVLVFSGFFLRKREKIFCRIFLFCRGFFFVLFLIMSDEYHACSCQGCTANTCLWLDFYYAIYAEHQLMIPRTNNLTTKYIQMKFSSSLEKKLYLGQLNTVNEELYLMRTINAHIQAASTKHNTVRLLFFYFAIWADHQLMIPRTNNFTIELHTDESEWASCNAAPFILPKSWWAYAHPTHPLPSSLLFELGISWWSPGLIIVP